ncbi:MAG: HAD family hydrolase [Verrucomicrobiae bacterium]|nr:HAD family hydrolase [Verrucomicrobiae bacterium]
MKKMTVKNIKAICFDFGNTLASNDALNLSGSIYAAREIFARCRIPWDARKYSVLSQRALKKAWQRQGRIFGDVPVRLLDSQKSGEVFVETFCAELLVLCGKKPSSADVRESAKAYYRGVAEASSLYPKTREVLGLLRSYFNLAIVSNNPVEYVTEPVRKLGLKGLFDAVIISGEEGPGINKPEKSIFSAALKKLRTRPDNTVMVGDSLTDDVAGARAAGLISVWINRTGEKAGKGAPRPDFEIKDIGEMLELFVR